MPRLTRQQRSRLALDIISKAGTDIELGRRYGITRSSVWRLRKELDRIAPPNATWEEEETLSSKDNDNKPGRTRQVANPDKLPNQSQSGPPIAPPEKTSPTGR